MNIIQNFKNEMENSGLICEEQVVFDGKIHRFHVQHDSPGSKNGWYVLYDTPVPFGIYGCWKRNIRQIWHAANLNDFSLDQKEAYKIKITEAHIQATESRKQAQIAAKQKAKKIWDEAEVASSTHPYLIDKKIKAFNIKQINHNLLIPLYDTQNELRSLQFISSDGKKIFLADGATKGFFYHIGKLTPEIYLCEGYATGATIHEATNCYVIIVFSSGNLISVSQAIHNKYFNHKIIICADNDQWSENNIGVIKAIEASKVFKSSNKQSILQSTP